MKRFKVEEHNLIEWKNKYAKTFGENFHSKIYIFNKIEKYLSTTMRMAESNLRLEHFDLEDFPNNPLLVFKIFAYKTVILYKANEVYKEVYRYRYKNSSTQNNTQDPVFSRRRVDMVVEFNTDETTVETMDELIFLIIKKVTAQVLRELATF